MRITRNKQMRTAAATLAAVGLLLAGCSSPSGSSPNDPGGSANGGKLSVWFPGSDKTEIDLVTKKIAPAFEKDTGAKLEVTFVDWGDLSTKLNAAFAAGTAPDVFGHGPAAVADFVANDRLTSLDDDVAKMSDAERKDLAATLPGGQVGGTQYLIPLSIQGDLIMYNAKDFTDAGLDPDTPPTTWEDVRADAIKLTKRDGGGEITRSGLLVPSQAIARQQTFASLLLSEGGKQLDDAGAKATFNSPEGVKAMDFFTSLFNGTDAVSANLGADYLNAPAAQQPLGLGTASMAVLSPNAMLQIKKLHPELDLRVMAPPKFAGAEQGHYLGGAGPGLMINKDSKNSGLAWKFIQYMISKDTSTEYTQGIGAVPPRASAVDTAYVAESPVLSAFVKDAPQFVPNPNVAGWVQVRDVMDKAIEQALNKKESAKDALDQAASKTDSILGANG